MWEQTHLPLRDGDTCRGRGFKRSNASSDTNLRPSAESHPTEASQIQAEAAGLPAVCVGRGGGASFGQGFVFYMPLGLYRGAGRGGPRVGVFNFCFDGSLKSKCLTDF